MFNNNYGKEDCDIIFLRKDKHLKSDLLAILWKGSTENSTIRNPEITSISSLHIGKEGSYIYHPELLAARKIKILAVSLGGTHLPEGV